MNRQEEYDNLLAELHHTPHGLEYTVTRAITRARKSAYIRRFLAIPVGSIAMLLILFVALVNLSPSFATASSRIPLLRELTAAVAFSPSLSVAVDNEYVQPINLEQTSGGITMRVEYVIVDQKQLNIFYTLQSDNYTHLDAAPDIRSSDGAPLSGYSLGSGHFETANGELRQFTVDFMEQDVPGNLILECKIRDIGGHAVSPPVIAAEPDYISKFAFTLSFDPYFTLKGETITLNQSFVADEQHLTATTVDIYPTHIRLNLQDDDRNSAWLQSLTFYLEDEKGKRFESISNGVTATGSVDSPFMASHRLESSFFSQSESLTLYITDAVWLDKDMSRVKVDLANGVADRLPEGVKLERAVRQDDHWLLTFSAVERKDNSEYQLFGTKYHDESGKEYEFNSWSSSTGYFDEQANKYVETPGLFRVEFALDHYPFDTVYLSPSFSRKVKLETPVMITIK